MQMICPICGYTTQHADTDKVVKCRHCLRSFQLEPNMNTESQQQIARSRAKSLLADGKWSHNHYNEAEMEDIAEHVILSAIERATEVCPKCGGIESGHVPGCETQVVRTTQCEAAQPQRSEQQEWTSEMVNATLKDRPFAASTIASKHNAELAAERQRRQEAQADTEKYRSNCIFWGLMIIANANGGDWESASKDWQIAAAKYRDESLLHEHDAEVRKPLVDLLRKLKPWQTPDDAKIIDDALAKVKQ